MISALIHDGQNEKFPTHYSDKVILFFFFLFSVIGKVTRIHNIGPIDVRSSPSTSKEKKKIVFTQERKLLIKCQLPDLFYCLLFGVEIK